MEERPRSDNIVLVIGAGPAGLFTAQVLAEQGISVVMLNRDIKPGGLAEYGIYYDKHRIKDMLRSQFRKIVEMPEITYFGNVSVGERGDVTLAQLGEMRFSAIVIAVGAQGTKWLGLPGEDLTGVYHAKDLIYYYNGLPPFSERTYEIGKRVALIGVGNVMADIAHWLVRDLAVDEVIAVARRGPAEVKFTQAEFAYVAANLDVAGLDEEIDRVSERMEAVGQRPEEAQAYILSALKKAPDPVSETRIHFRFLSSPSRIIDDGTGHVGGLQVEDTALVSDDQGQTHAQRLGTHHVLDVDTVVFCIGDRVSDTFGLPVQNFSFVKHPEPRYPVRDTSFEAYDPDTCQPIDGVFVVGWARKASEGQVGLARRDARDCVAALSAYLADSSATSEKLEALTTLSAYLQQLDKPVITKEDALRLVEIEAETATAQGNEHFRFTTNREMIAALGLGNKPPENQ